MLSASLPFTFSLPDSVYHFSIGTLAAGQRGQISLQDSVLCTPGIRGLQQCTKAWLTPGIQPCQWPAGYDGSLVLVNGSCIRSVPSFTLRNIGSAMRLARTYRVYADMLLTFQGTYQLGANDSIRYAFPQAPQGAVLRLEARQDSLSPSGPWQYAFAACGPQATALSAAWQASFPPSASPVEAQDCQVIRDSYDPNDKQVQPKGITPAGNIEPGTWLSYKIRFMNKGNDTAYSVKIVDTLSNNLDIATLQIGASSHPFTPKLTGKGQPVLTFELNDIYLPDSTRSGTNKASGFISFKIKASKSAPLGTQIQNQASIYFDFNDAVITNTTLNTLYRPTLTPGVIDTVVITATKARQTQATFSIQPNPGSGVVQITTTQPGTLHLYSAEGKAQTYPIQKGTNTLNLAHLPAGLYLLRLNGQSLRWVRE